MAVKNATGYERTTREPLDVLYLHSGSAYPNTASVNSSVDINVRYTGSMHNVAGELYWYKDGVQDSNLIPLKPLSASYADNSLLLDGHDRLSFATTASNYFRGNESIEGYIEFPTNSTPGNTTSSLYFYSSGSGDKDFYFTGYSGSVENTVRLGWIEGNLYTGLLYGGIISAVTGSTTFNISAGEGIIVDMNASTTMHPHPIVKRVTWSAFSAVAPTYLTSSIQTFVGIDRNGSIIQQTSPWNDGQYNTSISLGTVLHQNKININGNANYPNVAYGYKQRSYDFVKAFGPLKLSGLSILPSSSLGLTVSSGTAFADGRNYATDPNNPSYITDPGTGVSKIFRYHQSGSDFVQDTNNGAGYTLIDPANYNVSGTLTPVPGTGSNRYFSVQRVFWFPNSATKGIVVYYGNAVYPTLVDAIANVQYEAFFEVENTKQNAVYLGAIALRNDAVFTDSTSYSILPGGLFRSVGGSGGGGTAPAARLVDLADVTVTAPTDAQPLAYDTSLSRWTNHSAISASLHGVADRAITASYADNVNQDTLTGSFVTTNTAQTIYAAKTFSASVYMPYLDSVLTGGPDVLNIGTSNADIINIGWAGAMLNFQGTSSFQNTDNLSVKDKLIRLNVSGSAGSGASSGFEIEEGGVVTGYFATNATRNGWDFKAPGTTYQATLGLDLLSAARTVKVPDDSGTLLLDKRVLNINGYSYDLSANRTWTLTTSDIAEGTNLYFTNARAIAATLTGYVSGAGTITSADSILSAIQKLNGNIGVISGSYVSSITPGTDMSVSAATGAVTINNTSTLATVTGRGATTSTAVTFNGGLTSTTGTFSGDITANGRILLTTNTSATSQGQVGYNSSAGFYVWGKAGSFSDFLFYNSAGNSVMYNPTGTQNIVLSGALSGTSASFSVNTTGPVASFTNTNTAGTGNGILVDVNSLSGIDNYVMNLITNGVSRFYVREDGNVGIRTTTFTYDGRNAGFVYQGSSGTMYIRTSGAELYTYGVNAYFGSGTAGYSTILMSGAGITALTLDASQVATFASLAGSGNRIIYANASGTLGSMVIGSGLSFDGTTLTATGGSAGTVTYSGTTTSGYFPLWTSASDITNSVMSQSGGTVTVAGNFSVGTGYDLYLPANRNIYTNTSYRIASWNTSGVLYLGDVDNGYTNTVIRSGGADRLTFTNAGAATFSSTVAGTSFLAGGRTIIAAGYIADQSGTGNNIGIAFGASAIFSTNGAGTLAAKDFGSSGNPWGNIYGAAATFSSSVTASSFSGAGTGLTGTASSLTAGNATNSTQWNGWTNDFTTPLSSGIDYMVASIGGVFKRVTSTAVQTFLGLGSYAYRSSGLAELTGATFTSSVTATTFYKSSDMRLKTELNNTPFTGNIASLRAKFYMKDGKQEYGYYAQHAQAIMPYAVSTREDGYLDLDYTQVLVAKMETAEQKIKRLESVEDRVSRLEEENSKLKTQIIKLGGII